MNRQFITTLATLILLSIAIQAFSHVATPRRNHPDNNGKPCETGKCCPVPANGAPVWKINKINSNIYIADTPLWYSPAIGPQINAKLSYNSQAETMGNEIFGNKWVFGYGGYLTVDGSGNVTIFMADGREDTFTADGNGVFTQECACDAYMVLTKVNDNHYELRTKSDTTYIYSTPDSGATKLFFSEVRNVHNLSLTVQYTDDLLTSITDALGQVTTLHYNADGLVEKISDPFGREALFGYDTDRNLIRLTDIGGYQTAVEYIDDAVIGALVNDGGRTEFYIEPATTSNSMVQYPEPGTDMGGSSRITITHPDGGKEEFYYNGVNGTAWHVAPGDYRDYYDPVNNFSTEVPKTIYTYANTVKGVRANLGSVTYPSGEKTIYGYDATTGKLISIADAAGNTRRMTYNDKGQIATRTAPSGVITKYMYKDNDVDLDKVIVVGLNNAGEITLSDMDYNDKHQVTSFTDKAGNTTGYNYNEYGQVTKITDPLTIETILNYDETEHRLTHVTRDGQEVYRVLSYDNIGRVKTTEDATGLQLSYGYDDLDHLTTVTYPDGKTETWEYNSPHSPHLLTATTDRGEQRTVYNYYPTKQLADVTEEQDNSISRFFYDLNGNLETFVDTNTNSTDFGYDSGNRLTSRTYADEKSLAYSYYNTGLLEKVTNSRNQTTTYYYNENGDPTSIDYQDDATADVTYLYDDFDRLEQIEDGSGITVFGYDSFSRLETIDGPWENDTITYTYDDLGRIETVQVENGRTRTHVYDTLGRLKKIQIETSEYRYIYEDPKSPLIEKLIRPNNITTQYDYDGLNRLLEVDNQNASSEIINKYVYTYNNQDHNLDLRDSETITGGLPAPDETEGVTGASFNNVNQLRETQNPDEIFAYDDDGNMTEGYTAEGYEFTALYDEADRLASISYTDGDGKTHRTEYTYRYDSFLAQIEKYENDVLVEDTRIIRNGKLPIQERDASNTVTREYLWGQSLGGGIGGLLQLSQGGEDYSYLYDGKGNVVSVLDSAGTEVAQYRYNSFGKLVAQTGSLDQPFQFSTKRYDSQTGLNYYGYRFYNPAIERWMNRDPLGEEGGVNLYAFVQNNPVNWVDPNGEIAVPVFVPVVIGIGVALAIQNSDVDLSDINLPWEDEECNDGCSEYRLVYEENPKHGFHRRKDKKGRWISRRPTNGPYALSVSVPVGSRRRLAWDDTSHEIVVLPEHRTDEQNCIKYYHGYVADYMSDLHGRNDLKDTIKNNNWPLPPKK